MRIYKDIITGDEMFSDSYKMKLVDDVIYEVYGTLVKRTTDFELAGANPSAEEADELCISSYLREKKIFPFRSLLDVLNVLMNDNTGIRYRDLSRADVLVIVPLTFAGLIVMNGIVSLFQSYLTSPIYQRQIDSLNDLYVSSVPILVNKVGWKEVMVALLEDITKYGGWSDKVHGTDLERIAAEVDKFNDSIAFFMLEDSARQYLQLQDLLELKAYHVLSDTYFNRYLSAFYVRPLFRFTEHLNDIVHRLTDTGVFGKWKKKQDQEMLKYVWQLNRNFPISNASDMEKFTVPTVIWYGWIASVIIFVCEIMWSKIGRCRCFIRVANSLNGGLNTNNTRATDP